MATSPCPGVLSRTWLASSSSRPWRGSAEAIRMPLVDAPCLVDLLRKAKNTNWPSYNYFYSLFLESSKHTWNLEAYMRKLHLDYFFHQTITSGELTFACLEF